MAGILRRVGWRVAALLVSAWAGSTVAVAQSPGQESSQPFIFVEDRDQDGGGRIMGAWWLLATVERPLGSEVAGISAQRIGAALGPDQESWCSVEALTLNSFISRHRSIQIELDSWRASQLPSIFHQSGPFTGEGMLDARVGKYETCGGNARGAFILVTDRSEPREIVYVHAWPDWDGLIWLGRRGHRLFISSCFECDHSTELVYNQRAGSFSWRDSTP